MFEYLKMKEKNGPEHNGEGNEDFTPSFGYFKTKQDKFFVSPKLEVGNMVVSE